MTLREFVSILSANPDASLQFLLPDSNAVPAHFHVTEVGRVQKDFIDCGGSVHHLESCLLQVWVAHDVDHRLQAARLAGIIQKGADLFETFDLPVEIEYDNGVISQYPVRSVEVASGYVVLRLESRHTACLAPDRCGVDLAVLGQESLSSSCCAPGCCESGSSSSLTSGQS